MSPRVAPQIETHQHANWHDDAFFGLHYDLHANAGDTVLGQDLTVEHLVERLERVRPDWVQCDCKGHAGYTSWPTTVGSTSPGVVNDAVQIHREATRQLGIPLGMHYSGVWDTRAIELHPEWARVDAEGRPDGPQKQVDVPGQQTTISNRSDMTCRLSGYDNELMIPQMLELIDTYDVDGFWVDGENWASKPCWCDRCIAEFGRRTGIQAIPRSADQPHWDEWLSFHRDLFVEHVTTYADAVHARKRACMVCSNWMYTMRQPDPVRAPVDYLSGDFDWAWGSNRAAVEGRLLDSRGMPWDLMAWGFTKTGPMREDPPWVMKTATHLCQETAEVVALGGAVMIYDTPQRTGWLTDWHQDTLAEVAAFCRSRKEHCFRSQSVPQAAILHTSDHLYTHNDPLFQVGTATQAIEGALHALLETHRSTDILVEDAALARMDRYKLIVVPERTNPSEQLRDALGTFVSAGGHLLLSGPDAASDFPELVGATPSTAGATDHATRSGDPAVAAVFLPVGHGAVPVAGPWRSVTPDGRTEVWTYCLKQQEPTKDVTDQAAVTHRRLGRGSVVTVHGPIFRDYFTGHYPLLREFIAELIARMEIDWLVELDAPPRLELVLREKDQKLVASLINRGAGEALSPNRVIVEELPPVEHVGLRVKLPERPHSVSVVPYDRPTDWTYQNGWLDVQLDRVDIHTVVAIEPFVPGGEAQE
jgi:hypothetical protein